MPKYAEPTQFTRINWREKIQNQAAKNAQAKEGDIIVRGGTRYLVTAKGWRRLAPEDIDTAVQAADTLSQSALVEAARETNALNQES